MISIPDLTEKPLKPDFFMEKAKNVQSWLAMQHFESNWKTRDGLFIYAQGWRPEHEPKAFICLVHGLGEHSDRYEQLACYLTRAGYAVSAFDMRSTTNLQGKMSYIIWMTG